MPEFSKLPSPMKSLARDKRLADDKQVASSKQVADSKQTASKVGWNMISEIPDIPVEADLATVEYDVKDSPFLRVRFRGVSWRAKCNQSFPYEPGTPVKVIYRQGTTLIVAAIAQL